MRDRAIVVAAVVAVLALGVLDGLLVAIGTSLALLIRDGDGRPDGGLWAVTYYGWMFIQLLYLPAHLRRGGLGSRLLRQAEEVARRRGCRGVWLDTFSFQARPFYERHGYTMFGRIDDYPPGASRFFLAKRLDASAGRLDASAALVEKAAEISGSAP